MAPMRKNKSEMDKKKKSYSIKDFTMIKEVGEGSFGKVFLVQKKDDQVYYALKMLDKFHIIKNHKVMHVHRERDILTDCKHPNIISLIGTFQDDANLYFIMEHGDHGDLNRMLRKLSARVAPHTLRRAAALRPGQVLLRRDRVRARLPAPKENHTPRPETREHSHQQALAPQARKNL